MNNYIKYAYVLSLNEDTNILRYHSLSFDIIFKGTKKECYFIPYMKKGYWLVSQSSHPFMQSIGNWVTWYIYEYDHTNDFYYDLSQYFNYNRSIKYGLCKCGPLSRDQVFYMIYSFICR
jgi:hypothetical protein